LRLARFNVQATTTDNRYFTGLPIPAAASLIAATILLDEHIFSMGREVRPIVILLMIYSLAFLMVSRLRYPSLKEFRLHRERPFDLLVWSVLALIILALAPQLVLFTFFALYAVFGIVDRPVRAILRRVRRAPPSYPETGERKLS
jgi:CDP-diacylglycerol---serine O-phosphatidyltransferase